jgi:putative endonuclease
MAEHNNTGKEGETLAAKLLEQKGFRILRHNYRYHRYEVDLIAAKDKLLVFVEVKTRSGQQFGYPEEFVSQDQITFIRRAAENFIYSINWQHYVRFDVIAVQIKDNQPVVKHFEDAFY